MKIFCLIENTVGNKLCQAEHGFSVYVETEDKKILVDTGASDLFAENAKALDVDLTKVEMVFLSHGHYDHGGGLVTFREINKSADIIMQKDAFGSFWHKSESVERYIGLSQKVTQLENLLKVEGDYSYCENVEVFRSDISDKSKLLFWPKGNLVLKEKIDDEYRQDNFFHEQYLVLKEDEKMVLISGCAHNGILNILNIFNEKYHRNPDVVISGFHMKKKNGYTKEDYELIKETAKKLKNTGVICYTGHCTGEEPYQIMKEIMGEQLHYLHCGDVVEV